MLVWQRCYPVEVYNKLFRCLDIYFAIYSLTLKWCGPLLSILRTSLLRTFSGVFSFFLHFHLRFSAKWKYDSAPTLRIFSLQNVKRNSSSSKKTDSFYHPFLSITGFGWPNNFLNALKIWRTFYLFLDGKLCTSLIQRLCTQKTS